MIEEDKNKVEIEAKVIMGFDFKRKIDWFSSNYKSEIAGFITGRIEKDFIFCDDLLIPEQEADVGCVDISGKQQIGLIKEYGKEI